MIISPDQFRFDADGKYDSSKEASALAWHQSFEALKLALQRTPAPTRLVLLVGIPGSGKSTWASARLEKDTRIYFDATFSKRIEREPLIQMAATAGVLVEAVVFVTPISVCIARNWKRPENRRVPYPVMASMLENLRKEPVCVEEGFVKITAVHPL